LREFAAIRHALVSRAAGGPDALGRADAPAGRSTGSSEAQELRDRDLPAYRGNGVTRAVAAVNDVIGPALVGRDAADQAGLDALLCALDGTPNRARLGSNAVVAVSLAAARVAASAGRPLHEYLRPGSRVLPGPLINLLNGGRLTSNDLEFQEIIMMPVGARSFSHALQMASECHMALFEIVVARYGKLSGNTGDEGGFATPIIDVREALKVLHDGVAAAGYAGDAVYALDCAAGMGVCVSERSGETEDPVIADLTVALGCGQIKTGSPVRGERTSKYNRLLEIEESLGSDAVYPGRGFRLPAQAGAPDGGATADAEA
jgi:enolase